MTRKEAIERAAVGAGSHADLARLLGVTPTTLTRWKHEGATNGDVWQWALIARKALVKLEDIEHPRKEAK